MARAQQQIRNTAENLTPYTYRCQDTSSHTAHDLTRALPRRSDDPPSGGRWPLGHPGGHRWAEGPKVKVGRSGRRCSFGVQPGPPAHARPSPTRRDLAVASGSRLEVLALGGGGQAMRHIGPVGPRHQLCDLAEVQPRLRLRARLVRELAARSRPSRRRRLAGTNQPSTGAVKCNPASARRAAPRAGRGHVAARLPACSGSIVARRHRRVVASTMAAHRCTSTPIEVVGAPGGAVVLQQRRRGSPAGACGLPLARQRGPAGPRPARAGAHAERTEA